MTKAVADFIEALLVHYPVRHDTEEREDAWVKSMIAALRGYGPDILKEVADDIIRTRKYRNFPLLSEILDKCDDVEKRREMRKWDGAIPQLRPPADSDQWSSERVRFAYDLVRSGMGREAARDNPCWVMCLWHFARRNQRLPSGHEVDALKREAREFDQAYADTLRGAVVGHDGKASGLPNAKELQKLGASMIAKRERLCREVLGQ